MTWYVWVIVGVAVVVLPLLIGLLFSGQGMSGGGGGGAGVFGAFEEAFSPARHAATQEREQQKLVRAEAASPDDEDPSTHTEPARPAASAAHPLHPDAIPQASPEPGHTLRTAPPPGWLSGK